MDSPFAELNISDQSTVEQVKARWRELAAKLHPDRGGDAEEFDRLRKAYDRALELANQPIECEQCGGTGKIWQRSGFHNISVICPVCNGSGELERA